MAQGLRFVIAIVVGALFVPNVASASTVISNQFLLIGPGPQGAALEGVSGPIGTAVNGLTGTFTATVAASTGTLNQTLAGFGINAAGAGDATALLDDVNGSESIIVSFDRPVSLTELTLSEFFSGASDQATLTIGSFAPLTLLPLATSQDIYSFASNNRIEIGETLVLSYATGNGFSFDNFTVTTTPEPSTLVLAAVGMLGFCLRRRPRN